MYIIKKDGLYLAGYQYNGIEEIDADGVLHPVLTGVYSADRRDAMVVELKSLAERFGGEAIRVEMPKEG